MQSYLWIWLLGAPAIVALIDALTTGNANTTYRGDAA